MKTIVLLFTNDMNINPTSLERKLNTYNGVTFEVIQTNSVNGWEMKVINTQSPTD